MTATLLGAASFAREALSTNKRQRLAEAAEQHRTTSQQRLHCEQQAKVAAYQHKLEEARVARIPIMDKGQGESQSHESREARDVPGARGARGKRAPSSRPTTGLLGRQGKWGTHEGANRARPIVGSPNKGE